MWTCWGHQSFEVNLVSWTNWKGLKFGFPAKDWHNCFGQMMKKSRQSIPETLVCLVLEHHRRMKSDQGWASGAMVLKLIATGTWVSTRRSCWSSRLMWSFGCPSVDCFINKLARHSTTNAVSPTQRYHYGCSRGKLQQCTLTQTSNLNNAFFVLKIKYRLRV